jgi:hypothetical protein
MNKEYETNYRLLYTNPDTGMLCIVIPSGEAPLEHLVNGSVPSGIKYWKVDEYEIPEDRSFRDAWELDESIAGKADGKGKGPQK